MESEPLQRFKWEYKQFLEFVQQRKPQRAMIYAKTLGISRRTLIKWMAQPELRQAMAEAMDEIIDNMQKSGKDDWRMWRELAKMVGLDDADKLDITSDDKPIQTATVVDLGNVTNLNKAKSDSTGDTE